MTENEIAICGVSARIAKCKNLEQFKQALFNGEELITHDHNRWNCDFLDTPNSIGVLSDLEYFDAGFFGISPKQANRLDPRTRILLEVVFECIADAGYNPEDLRGSNTAVILAIAENSNEGLMDRSLAIMANTISYYLDLKGPSYAIDTGCSSSVYGLNQAVEALSFGSCDNVIVCSAQVHLLPTDSVQLSKLGVLSKEGKCKTFDDDRDGYVKSEAVVSIFLQKQNRARRIYATIAGIGCNVDGFKNEGMFNPSSQSQLNLLRRIYEKFKLNPQDVEYVDAHGTGTLIGDIKECAALADFFSTKDRPQPMKIGSTKTNAGHCENAAGLVSLVKLIIVINTGIIPANKHFENPALDIPSIDNKKLEVVQKNTPYNGGLLSLNSFGIGGANGHVVIRPYLKNSLVSTDLKKPRLIVVTGRTEESVINLLNTIEKNKENLAFLTLLETIFETPLKNPRYKGFLLLNKNKREIRKCINTRVPIWFSYSGMGSQWPGMAKHLMNFKIFRETLEKCANTLKPYDLDLMDIVLNGDATTFDDPEKCFPAIIAVLVGLTDMLYSLGIKPDGIIGHSLGEIGCAYGDGLITLEQAILTAHARGLATKQTKLIPGLMASVGLTMEECENIIPEDVYVACHNSQQNVTISGPKRSVENFVKTIRTKGIFARIVNTAGIAFHSKHIHGAGPFLLEQLKRIMPEPKRRSSKWLPSAIPVENYSSYLGKFNSAEYHYHNFMNRVLYKQVLDKVPKNAILLEIAPTGLFQAIFKRALDESIVKLHLTNKDMEDNLDFFLTTIGKIYLSTSMSLNLKAINETAYVPLDGRTPFISSLIQWDHWSTWNVPKYVHNTYQGEKMILNLKYNEFKFLYGHCINGYGIFPSTGILFLVWKAFANKHEKEFTQCSVSLQNVNLLNPVKLKDILEFHINILQSGDFEIIENSILVAKGTISWLNESLNDNHIEAVKDNDEKIESVDIYTEFRLRGYNYSNIFQEIQNLDVFGVTGNIKWHRNWIAFMESIVQSITFHQYSNLVTPVYLLHVNIDPGVHQKLINHNEGVLRYHYDKVTKTAFCGGIQIQGLASQQIKHKKKLQMPTLYQFDFIPNELTYQGQHSSHLEFSLSMALQITMENNTKSLKTYITILGVEENDLKATVLGVIHKRFIKNVKFSSVGCLEAIKSNMGLIICPVKQYLSPVDILKWIKPGVFFFCKVKYSSLNELGDNIVFKCSYHDVHYVLLRKYDDITEKFEVIKTSNEDFGWIEKVKKNINIGQKMYLVSNTLTTGLIGLFNCLKEELQAHKIRIFILNNSTDEDFDPNSNFYRSQVKKDLTVNIYHNNRWCTYRILPLICNAERKMENYYMKIKEGRLEWVKELNTYGANDLMISVRYASLNRWHRYKYQEQNDDVLPYLAMEFSGISKSGENVIGISNKKRSGTMTDTKLYWTLPKDSNISLKEAATIPLDYMIAYYALCIKGTIKSHDNILISGTDPTCLAATFFALERGCNVFIEIKNPNQTFTIENFFRKNSRLHLVPSSDFLKEIMPKLNNKGYNVLFFSNEENINRCHTEILAKNSKLISVYQNNTEIDSYISNAFMLKECQIYRIHLNTILTLDADVLNLIKPTIQNYLNENALKPFNYSLENASDSPNKVLEFLNSESDEKLVLVSKNINGKIYLDNNKSYLIVGGLGGVGIELTKWLIKKGATKIILNHRNSTIKGYGKFLIEKWHLEGITILTNNSDARTMEGATSVLNEALNIAPVGGIFNLAMVLNDKLFQNLSSNDFLNVVSPKLHISQNLDVLSQKLCPYLQYFVVFSAMTVLGNQGQSNYGFANSSIEFLCKERKNKCLPSLVVQWGCIGDVGYVARQNLSKSLLTESPQSIYSCLKTLEHLLLKDSEVVSSAVYNDIADTADDTTADNIFSNLATILGAESENYLDKNTPLVDFGMDSICSLEIRNLIRDEYGIEISSCELRKLTLEQIKNIKINSESIL